MAKVISRETYEKLKEELERLKTISRKEIAEKIKIAKEFGDLSENAEYQSALEEQRRLEKRIAELENLLKTAKVSRNISKSDKVHLGSEVEIENLKTKKRLKFKIVGFGEANPLENKISQESPLVKALIGKRKGDVVEVNLGGKVNKFKIVKIN